MSGKSIYEAFWRTYSSYKMQETGHIFRSFEEVARRYCRTNVGQERDTYNYSKEDVIVGMLALVNRQLDEMRLKMLSDKPSAEELLRRSKAMVFNWKSLEREYNKAQRVIASFDLDDCTYCSRLKRAADIRPSSLKRGFTRGYGMKGADYYMVCDAIKFMRTVASFQTIGDLRSLRGIGRVTMRRVQECVKERANDSKKSQEPTP